MPLPRPLRSAITWVAIGAAGVCLAVLAASIVVALPPAPPSPHDLPACYVGDLLAPNSGYEEWPDTLLDPAHRLPFGYVPPDLQREKVAGGPVVLRAFVFGPLREMLDAAAAEGIAITITSAYRSYAEQAALQTTLGHVDELVARAGHSEHQLGTAVDLSGGADWLRANGPRFGFALSYPAGRPQSATCYQAEPWHFRFMGVERAQAIAASGLSVREWLWAQRQ